jgi:hypothetical protein
MFPTGRFARVVSDTDNPRRDPAAIIEAGKAALRERFEAMR